MSWSYRIATVRGINLKVHATFALIVAIAAANWAPLGAAGIAFGTMLVLLLFACVTLHEFGHAFAARVFDMPVREIVLLPIGGVAFLGRPTRNPVQELVIAAAGPAVNVAIVAVLMPVLFLIGEPWHLAPAVLHPAGANLSFAEALRWLISANISLVLFNLIPAFPLDGGRILRGALGLYTDWGRATRWATATGQILAMGMGTWGVINGQLMLVVIAALIFFSAGATHAEEHAHSVLSTRYVGDACNRHAIALSELDRVSTVTRYLLTSYQPDFAVLRGNELLGVVRRSQVLQALALQASDPLVTAIMRRVPTVWADRTLADTRRLLEDQQAAVGAVYSDYGYLGLVSLEDIAEAEAVLAFAESGLRRGRQPARPGWLNNSGVRPLAGSGPA